VKKLTAAVLLAAVTLTTPALAEQSDPLENFNRQVLDFNDLVDSYAIKPLAEGYEAAMPELAQQGVSNFFDNIGDVGNFANNALQLKGDQALLSFSRFAFNSTFGLAGLIDVASVMGIERHPEDLGQTLGYWGVPSGPYLVLPLLGPSTVRDTVNLIPGQDPWMYVSDIPVRNTGLALRLLDQRVELLAVEDLVVGDRYLYLRDIYLSNRQQQIDDGVSEQEFDDSDF